jgi:hypothetical protein
MALPHAQPLDVIGIGPLGPALADAVSTSLIKTARLQLMHLVLPAGTTNPSTMSTTNARSSAWRAMSRSACR